MPDGIAALDCAPQQPCFHMPSPRSARFRSASSSISRRSHTASPPRHAKSPYLNSRSRTEPSEPRQYRRNRASLGATQPQSSLPASHPRHYWHVTDATATLCVFAMPILAQLRRKIPSERRFRANHGTQPTPRPSHASPSCQPWHGTDANPSERSITIPWPHTIRNTTTPQHHNTTTPQHTRTPCPA